MHTYSLTSSTYHIHQYNSTIHWLDEETYGCTTVDLLNTSSLLTVFEEYENDRGVWGFIVVLVVVPSPFKFSLSSSTFRFASRLTLFIALFADSWGCECVKVGDLCEWH